MTLPPQIPGLKAATILTAVYAIIWISLEGNLVREIVMGVGVTAVFLLHTLQKWLGGQTVSLKEWLQITAMFGFFGGFAGAPLTYVAMVLKTGLHAHGAEFTRAEFEWVIHQMPLWTIVGLLIGLALGMLTAQK